MEFVGGKYGKGSKRNHKSSTKVNDYGHNVQMYLTPPTDVISLLEFENLAVERLKILKSFESIGQSHVKYSNEYVEKIDNAIRKDGTFMRIANRSTDTKQAHDAGEELNMMRKRDHISHFILRLAFCKTPESRQWFLQQELDLFRFRMKQESPNSMALFLKLNEMHFEVVRPMEKKDLLSQLSAAFGISNVKFENTDELIYKVPFTEALDLVKNRRVLLRYGFAYVRSEDMVSIVAGRFRANLSKFLAMASRFIGFMQEEDRLGPVLQKLNSKAYLGKDFSANQNENTITPEMIDGLSQASFPLCMKKLHDHLKREHHLKHGARMQYGLFLKAIGLRLEDALKFWRSEFCKSIDSDKFDKHYAYNIRHNYGKEGKRADYTPYSCSKIIMSSQPGPGDCHGCPFKHTDAPLLQQRLKDLKLDKNQTENIVSLCKSSRYDQACTRYFEMTHHLEEGALGHIITHPNAYFEESRKILASKTKPVPIKTEHVGVYSGKGSLDDGSIDESLISMNVP